MKICERCGEEISTKDGDNLCAACDAAAADGRRQKRNRARREREAMMRDCGLVKVRGALGGVYWE